MLIILENTLVTYICIYLPLLHKISKSFVITSFSLNFRSCSLVFFYTLDKLNSFCIIYTDLSPGSLMGFQWTAIDYIPLKMSLMKTGKRCSVFFLLFMKRALIHSAWLLIRFINRFSQSNYAYHCFLWINGTNPFDTKMRRLYLDRFQVSMFLRYFYYYPAACVKLTYT